MGWRKEVRKLIGTAEEHPDAFCTDDDEDEDDEDNDGEDDEGSE